MKVTLSQDNLEKINDLLSDANCDCELDDYSIELEVDKVGTVLKATIFGSVTTEYHNEVDM